MACLSLLHGLQLLICFHYSELVLAVDDQRQSLNPGRDLQKPIWSVAFDHMTNSSLFSSRHVSLYFYNVVELAKRPGIAGWIAILIPCILLLVQRYNQHLRQRTAEAPTKVSDTIGIGMFSNLLVT